MQRGQALCSVQSVEQHGGWGCVPSSGQQAEMSGGVLVFGMQQCSPPVWWLSAVMCLSFLFDFLTPVFDPVIFSAEMDGSQTVLFYTQEII